MKMRFPKSYKGKTFTRPIWFNGEIKYEKILIDKIPSEIYKSIDEIAQETIHQIKTESTDQMVVEQLHLFSNWIYENIGFNLYDSAKEFDYNNADEDLFYKGYLLDNIKDKPLLISELYEEDALNCISQSLIIKEVLKSTEWGLYVLFNNQSMGAHHLLARERKPNIIKIDGISATRKENKHMPLNEIHLMNQKKFSRRYVPTPYIQ